jgi:hypothetical protein
MHNQSLNPTRATPVFNAASLASRVRLNVGLRKNINLRMSKFLRDILFRFYGIKTRIPFIGKLKSRERLSELNQNPVKAINKRNSELLRYSAGRNSDHRKTNNSTEKK